MNTATKTFLTTLFMCAFVVVLGFYLAKGVLYFYQHFPSLQDRAITFWHLCIGLTLWNGSAMPLTWIGAANGTIHEKKALCILFALLVVIGAALVSQNMGLSSILSQSFIFLTMCVVKFRRLARVQAARPQND